MSSDMVTLQNSLAIHDAPEDPKVQSIMDTIKIAEDKIEDMGIRVFLKIGDKKVSVSLRELPQELFDDPELLKIVYKLTQVSGTPGIQGGIQQLFGIWRTGTRRRLVVENMNDRDYFISFSRIFKTKIHDLSDEHLFQICYELADTVNHLHSLGIVVKVLSDKAIFFRILNDKLSPVVSDVGYYSRRVSYVRVTKLTESRPLWAPPKHHLIADTIHRSIRSQADITNNQIYGG